METSWPARTQRQLRDFAAERDWEQFHTPRNLVLALVGEVGELAELYQWSETDAPPRQRVAEELADVAIYLLRLADVAEVDLEDAVETKIAMNGRRYPASEWRGRSGKAE
jgi:dCTP diphosphatase